MLSSYHDSFVINQNVKPEKWRNELYMFNDYDIFLRKMIGS